MNSWLVEIRFVFCRDAPECWTLAYGAVKAATDRTATIPTTQLRDIFKYEALVLRYCRFSKRMRMKTNILMLMLNADAQKRANYWKG
eukprot:scaffold64941_cov77-Cyclotella_meneghiniana.AAC.3